MYVITEDGSARSDEAHQESVQRWVLYIDAEIKICTDGSIITSGDKKIKKVYLFSRSFNTFSSQQLISELLYVGAAVVTCFVPP